MKVLDKSIAAALSAIEVYNKPDFQYREECFTILLVNAWELMLKAKILKDNRNKVRSLYVYQQKRIKRNRCNVPLTIDITCAMDRVDINQIVKDNIFALLEIRDAAIHYYNNMPLKYIVYTLGVASLRNYCRMVEEWFDRSLSEYNFYILPLGFTYEFDTHTMLGLRKQPSALANLIRAITENQTTWQSSAENDGYHFVCEIQTDLRSAKKFAGPADLTVRIDQEADAPFATRIQNLLECYPYSYYELVSRIRAQKDGVNSNDINRVIKDHAIKQSREYSAYVFRNKAQQDKHERNGTLPIGTASIYNESAVRFIVSQLT